MQCTAVYQKQGKWYLGWIEEIPGVNTQGKTLKETKESLKEALEIVLDARRLMPVASCLKKIVREAVLFVRK